MVSGASKSGETGTMGVSFVFLPALGPADKPLITLFKGVCPLLFTLIYSDIFCTIVKINLKVYSYITIFENYTLRKYIRLYRR